MTTAKPIVAEPREVRLFVDRGTAPFSRERSDARSVVTRTWSVAPDIAAVAAAPDAIVIDRPDGAAPVAVQLQRFLPREGYTFTDDGEAIPSERIFDLSYDWFGKGDGIELAITVSRGALEAVINGGDYR